MKTLVCILQAKVKSLHESAPIDQQFDGSKRYAINEMCLQ